MKQTFGQRVQILRNNTGLSQEELGKEVGVAAAAISHIEADLRTPSLEVFAQLCRRFAVAPQTLLGSVYVVQCPPCPFCGFAMSGGPVYDGEVRLWSWECDHCGATGPVASEKEDAEVLAYCRGDACRVSNALSGAREGVSDA